MTQNDPYIWLEEIDSDTALTWVRERNAIALAQLETPTFVAAASSVRVGIRRP